MDDLEDRNNRTGMKFNSLTCKIMHLGTDKNAYYKPVLQSKMTEKKTNLGVK